MIARAGSGWQTVLADLSMILFMVTASAVNDAPIEQKPGKNPAPEPPLPPALGEPVAVWRAGVDAPSLKQWLASLPYDPRQRLTIVAALKDAQAALALAASADRKARILLEQDVDGAPFAALTYDEASVRTAEMASPLQGKAANTPVAENDL